MINILNIYKKECFKWCLARLLYPADHHPARIRKPDRNVANELYFKDTKFPVKTRGIHKIEKRFILPLAFLLKKIWKSIYQKNDVK